MTVFGSSAGLQRDTPAACRTRAAADRIASAGADTRNASRKFDISAAHWDERAELLGRIDASIQKRQRLDAARQLFNGIGSSRRHNALASEVRS